MWTASRILWDQQILLLWLLLTPVFVGGLLLAFAAPFFYRDPSVENVENTADPTSEAAQKVT